MSRRQKVTVQTLFQMKAKGEKIVMLTAYDYQTAVLEDRSGIDMILVGDSLGMTVLGYENTIPVTLGEIIHHLKGVTRARPRSFVVADLPFMSYQASVQDAVRSAGRVIKEGGAEGVKLEGGRRMEPVLRAIVDADIPVMGHIGLTPQSLHHLGGFRVQGRDEESAANLLEEAKFLEEVGCFAIVIEGIPWQLGQRITTSVRIPTIGIGAGPHCDGQVLVVNDILGMDEEFEPKFVKRYAEVGRLMMEAFDAYIDDVKQGRFPDMDHSYSND
ncbi:MAG: 3-methyl-2-oxobutanoate hydroxymethyltransferase [Candidatus Krumholzibacteriota bacterium]|nr:3-methyl-2-oxobutanoate hydroxymethyltransferase [Candidatus Krumholzibacteriota bacterium]